MNVPRRLVRTVKLLANLERAHQRKTVWIRFGENGLERLAVNGNPLDVEFRIMDQKAAKIVDSGDAQKVIST